jgi:hypothetical protein
VLSDCHQGPKRSQAYSLPACSLTGTAACPDPPASGGSAIARSELST